MFNAFGYQKIKKMYRKGNSCGKYIYVGTYKQNERTDKNINQNNESVYGLKDRKRSQNRYLL